MTRAICGLSKDCCTFMWVRSVVRKIQYSKKEAWSLVRTLTWLIWLMWLLFLLSRTAEANRCRVLVHYSITLRNTKVLQTQAFNAGESHQTVIELHSLSVCDLLRKMVLARAWSEGFDSRASSGKQDDSLSLVVAGKIWHANNAACKKQRFISYFTKHLHSAQKGRPTEIKSSLQSKTDRYKCDSVGRVDRTLMKENLNSDYKHIKVSLGKTLWTLNSSWRAWQQLAWQVVLGS